MSRARQITVAAYAARAALAASVAAHLTAQEPNQLPGRVVENRGQAMPKGARRAVQASRTDRHRMKREAALELMDMSRRTLVVTHLHPRWLRECVSDMMAAGANIDMTAVDMLREAGPEGARMVVEAYVGVPAA